MTIPRPALQKAIECLESYAHHPGTAAIHDPIYALLQGEDPGQREALERALTAHSYHPASVELRSFLMDYISLPHPCLATVLERYGPIQNAQDLVNEVDRRLHKSNQQLAVLRKERDRLERSLAHANQSANAVAALGAFGVLFALVGWSIAFGFLEVAWMDVPVPEAPASAAAGQGIPAPGQLRPKSRP